MRLPPPRLWPRRLAQEAIRAYQLSLSAFVGRQCRYLPTCSAYTSDAIGRHGLWAGGWVGVARLCRCHPLGGSGFDPPPQQLSASGAWYRPWSYGSWRGPPTCVAIPAEGAPSPPA